MRSAWMVGGVLGLVAGLASVGLGLIGFVPFCACITGPANWVLPALTGLAAGGIAAMQVDWTQVEPGGGVAAGAIAGVKAGVVASALAALGVVVMALLQPMIVVVMNVIRFGGTDDLVTVLIASMVGALVGIAFNGVVAFVAALAGLGLGAAAGAVVGSSKG